MTNGQRGTVHSAPPNPPDPDTLERLKAETRSLASDRRDMAAAKAAAGAAGTALRDRVLDAIAFPAGCVVSAYWPMGSEIDPRPLIESLHERGHPLGLPVTLRRGLPLVFRAWAPGQPLVPGGFGTQVPTPERPAIRPQVLLVPLLAFDRLGYRLGYGGGFYDRTLAALRAEAPVCAVGLAYAGQEARQVPRDVYDQRLDWVVTEAEAIETASLDDDGVRSA